MHWLRRLYDWILSWAESPYGAAALFVLAFVESVFFPVPPDALLIALVLGSRRRAFFFAAICALGSLLGGAAGYALGHYAWLTGDGFTSLAHFFFETIPGFHQTQYYEVGQRFEEWGFEIIFAAGFTPIPYKVFTISAGAFDVHFALFLFASLISRSARFFIVAALIWWFGAPVKAFIDRYFNLLAILFTILLVGGFIVVRMLL